MRINWKAAILAGIAGTVVFDLVGLISMQQWWDVPAMLGMKLGTGLLSGVLAHYANGVLLSVIFFAIAPSLWGPQWLRALTYITIQTIFGVWLFMMPLLDMGIGGMNMGAMMPVMALIRHWMYALTVVAVSNAVSRSSAIQSAEA